MLGYRPRERKAACVLFARRGPLLGAGKTVNPHVAERTKPEKLMKMGQLREKHGLHGWELKSSMLENKAVIPAQIRAKKKMLNIADDPV